MTDKEIIIDGEKYNPCNGCKLWDGGYCTADRSYETNADTHRIICNEHLAKEFQKTYKQLAHKTQECEQKEKELLSNEKIINKLMKEVDELKQKCEKLKNQVDEDYNYYTTELKTLRDIISNKEKRNAALFLMSNRYRKALEEIEKYTREQFCDDCDYCKHNDKYNCYQNIFLDNLKEINRYKQALEPFEDEYFKGLDTKQIAELAKKSIRLTIENRKLENKLSDIAGICEQILDGEDYVRRIAKTILDIID